MDYLLQLAASPTAWIALATLIVMEIVLGIDNLIFISILTNKLPVKHRAKARRQHLLRIGNELPARLVRRNHDTNTHAAQLPIERPLFRRAFISIYKTI